MDSDDSVSRVCGIGGDDVEAQAVVVQDELVEGGCRGPVWLVVVEVKWLGGMVGVNCGVNVVNVVLLGVLWLVRGAHIELSVRVWVRIVEAFGGAGVQNAFEHRRRVIVKRRNHT